MKMISIVAPFFNEEESAFSFHEVLRTAIEGLEKDYTFELIYVDDGSKDGTSDILRDISANDRRVKVVRFTRNFGHQAAIMSGIHTSNGDAVITIDSDLQDPPNIIPKMIKSWESGHTVVNAVRKERLGESRFKKVTANIFYRLINSLSETELPRQVGDFRLLDRVAVDFLKSCNDQYPYVRGLVSWPGFRSADVAYVREERRAGETHYPLRKMVRLAVEAILGMSKRPLDFFSRLCIYGAFLTVSGIAFQLVQYLRHGDRLAPGWTSITVLILSMLAILLTAISVLMKYLGKIYDQVLQRPLAVVDIDEQGI